MAPKHLSVVVIGNGYAVKTVGEARSEVESGSNRSS